MSSVRKILYVEDEPALANIVKDMLERSNYEVALVSDGGLVLTVAESFAPDICLLDVMLPNVDGFTLGRQLSSEYPDLPIIFLTAKNQTADVLKGFKSGGNDYLKKPFSLEELLVRIENLIQLKNGATNETDLSEIAIGQYLFQPHKLLLIFEDEERKLTHRESEIIRLFSKYKNGIVHKKEILKEIWGDDSFYNSRSLDVYINRLREFFSKDADIEILTLRGVGYRFNVLE